MINTAAIVIQGNFNPPIFHPEWFERYKILPIQETQWAKSQRTKKQKIELEGETLFIEKGPIISIEPTKAIVNFESSVLKVELRKFEQGTTNPSYFDELKNAVLRVCLMLSHTPAKAVGINFVGFIEANNVAMKLREIFVGDNATLTNCFTDEFLVGASVKQEIPDGSLNCSINGKVDKDKEGVVVTFNYHRDLSEKNLKFASEVISSNFDLDLARTNQILDLIGRSIH
ncbi:MAG: hypothetical protein KQI62_02085 [Deltaproteobacteria bacterium]|nr:hypothetical protein [Deltaproteobacteria bacterium]